MPSSLLGNGTTTVALLDAPGAGDLPPGIDEHLVAHGAVLLRGLAVATAEDFAAVAAAVGGELYPHNHEHEPVTADGRVQTPVFYPADRKLLWHNENSFNQEWPLRLLFCCVQVPASGGETPVVDSRLVLRHLDRSIVDRFVERGVRYVRSYGDGLGRDWRTVFGTDDPAEVGRRCAAEGLESAWSPDGTLRTAAVRPAVVHHPVTGELSWFNQAQHWHPACLDEETREALLSVYDEEDLPRNCRYGDGSRIEDAVMAEILATYAELEYAFAWQEGDVLVIDNVLVAHGRNPYSGPRRLLVALGDMRRFDGAPQEG